MKWFFVFFTALFISIFPLHSLAMEEPWSVNYKSPTFVSTYGKREVVKADTHNHSNPLMWLVKGFQRFVSPVDGSRCSMYPTCSAYSVDAINKHGSLLGFVMTADRLMHETDEHSYAPLIRKYGTFRYYDPVENNDFWWHK